MFIELNHILALNQTKWSSSFSFLFLFQKEINKSFCLWIKTVINSKIEEKVHKQRKINKKNNIQLYICIRLFGWVKQWCKNKLNHKTLKWQTPKTRLSATQNQNIWSFLQRNLLRELQENTIQFFLLSTYEANKTKNIYLKKIIKTNCLRINMKHRIYYII